MYHLAGASRPYLPQHASNPVGWHPSGVEGLSRAQAGDKPILPQWN